VVILALTVSENMVYIREMKPRGREKRGEGGVEDHHFFAAEELTAKSRSRSTRWPTARW
jgi:hypothetical protein